MDTLQEFVDVASWVGGHITADPVVVNTVANAKPVWHHRGKATKVHSWTGEGASGEDVVVDGRVSGVSVQTVQSLTLCVGQISHGKQVTVKTLTHSCLLGELPVIFRAFMEHGLQLLHTVFPWLADEGV